MERRTIAAGAAALLGVVAWMNRPLGRDQINLYAGEIDMLKQSAEINRQTGRSMSDLGFYGDAANYLRKGMRQLEAVGCLNDHRNRRVAFYEAKANCSASLPS